MTIDMLLNDRWFVTGFVLLVLGSFMMGLGALEIGADAVRPAMMGMMLGILPGTFLTSLSFRRNPILVY